MENDSGVVQRGAHAGGRVSSAERHHVLIEIAAQVNLDLRCAGGGVGVMHQHGHGCLRAVASGCGGQLVLATGSEVILRLPATPSTGYRWQWASALPEAVHCKELPLAMSQDDLPGAPGEQQWQCQLPQKGRFVLTLGYQRSWEKLPPVRTFNVTLQVR